MNTIIIQPTKWSHLPEIDEVIEFSSNDADCLKEIRDVLKKHDRLERFGISLLHTHFEISEDEMMLETTDVSERTQIIRPVKIKDYEGKEDIQLMTTSLKFVEGEAVAVQNCGCLKNNNGHTGRHDPPIRT